MAKEKKQTKKVTVKESISAGCGSEPIRPGGDGPGDWQCRNGVWVWVVSIGG